MKIANVLHSASWGQVSPEALERGIGGREGAMIYLSREWARMGHEVTCFVNTDEPQRFNADTSGYIKNEGWKDGFHEYVPIGIAKQVLSNFPWDVVIAWECPSIFNDPEISQQAAVKIVEMQVAHLGLKEMKAAEDHCDYVAVLSDWHGKFMLHSGLDFDPERVVTLPNGVDIQRYPLNIVQEKFEKPIPDSPHFVYSSSPDRGLWQLLQAWPYIRKNFPKAKLQVGYGARKWTEQMKWTHGRQGEMALEIEKLLIQPGVKDLGKIGQDVLSKLQLEADAWLYPIDSIQATETGCITAIENAAAGNPIITTDADCMEEEFGAIGTIVDLPFDPEEYAAEAIRVITDPTIRTQQRKEGRSFAQSRDWSKIAPRWLTLFENQN